jgi:hypothetical protein
MISVPFSTARSGLFQIAAIAAIVHLGVPLAASHAQSVSRIEGMPFSAPSIWGSSPSSLYAVGGVGGIAYYDGSTWASQPVGGANRYSVFGTGTGTVYSAGQAGYQTGALYRSDNGGAWTQVFSANTELVGLWAGMDGSVLVGGDGRFFFSENGSSFQEVATGIASGYQVNRFESIWGRTATDAYLGGWGGLFHWNGATVTKVNLPTVSISRVHYSGTSWWAVGSNGEVFRGNGADWTPLDAGAPGALWGLWAFSDNDVWVGGQYGALRHFNGSSWTAYESGAPSGVWQLFAVDDETLFAGTFENPGAVLRVDISRTSVPEPPAPLLLGIGLAALVVFHVRRKSVCNA